MTDQERKEVIDRLAYKDWMEDLVIACGIEPYHHYSTYESWCIDCPKQTRDEWARIYLNHTEEELMATLLSGAK